MNRNGDLISLRDTLVGKSVRVGLLISYDGNKVVSNHAYFVTELKSYNNDLVVHCFVEKLNKQWITLKFNSSIVAVLQTETEKGGAFFSLQVYGKAELLDEYMINESFKIIESQHLGAQSPDISFDEFIRKYIGFKIEIDKAVQVYSSESPLFQSAPQL